MTKKPPRKKNPIPNNRRKVVNAFEQKLFQLDTQDLISEKRTCLGITIDDTGKPVYTKQVFSYPQLEAAAFDILKTIGFHRNEWLDVMIDYIYSNQFDKNVALKINPEKILCSITDERDEEFNKADHSCSALQKDFYKELKNREKSDYPIIIRVSPYAAIRDIHAFITENSKDIQSRQSKYVDPSVEIGKRRGSITRKRNYIIKKNANLPAVEIVKRVKKAGIDQDLYTENVRYIRSSKKKGA